MSDRTDGTLTLFTNQTLQVDNGSQVIGNLTVGAGATLKMASYNYFTNVDRFFVTGNLTNQAGSTNLLWVNGNAANPTNVSIYVTGSLVYGGTLSFYTNGVGYMQAGASFKLFNAASYSGSYSSIIPATPGPGLVWDTSKLNVNGTLFVGMLPTNNVTPSPVTVTYGNNVILTASAGGTPPLIYQWYSNNVPLFAATNSTLSLATPSVAASGNYTVVVTNAYGSVTNTASVTINPLAVNLTGTRAYDGTTNAAAAILSVANRVGSDTVTVVSGIGGLAGASPGAQSLTAVGTLALGGTAAGNYTLAGASGLVNINPLVVNLNGTRAYDGTTNAAAAILSVANRVGSDNVTVASGTGGLAGATAGSQSITSLGTLALGGTTASNYTLLGATGSVIIGQAATAVTLTSSENPSGYKDSVSFTATLPADATGNVVFSSTNGAFSTNTLTGTNTISLAITNLPRGTNVITALYSGDTNYLGSSASLNQIVTNHPPVASMMTLTRPADLPAIIALSDLATNWSDVDGDTVELAGINLTTTNGVTLFPINLATNLDGSYVVTNTAFLGYLNASNVNDQFSYSISDGQGGTNVGYVNIVVSTTAATSGQATGIIATGGNAVTVNFAGIPGVNYGVQRSTNLVSWTTIWTTNAPAGGLFNYTDSYSDLGGIAPNSAYYRLTSAP